MTNPARSALLVTRGGRRAVARRLFAVSCAAVIVAVLFAPGCRRSDEYDEPAPAPVARDGAAFAAPALDAGAAEAVAPDAGTGEAPAPDAGTADAPAPDAGTAEAPAPDAGGALAIAPDGGAAEAAPDAGSTAADAPTRPTRPARLTATLSGPNEAVLEWQPSSGEAGVARYEVLSEEKVVARTREAHARIAALAPARRACFVVRAVDPGGNWSRPSAAACVTTPDVTPPASPAQLTAEARPAEIVLRWTSSTDDVGVAGYELSRGDKVVARTAETTASEAGLRAMVEHCYTVRAYDAAGNRSPPAGPACATPPDVTPPTPPGDVVVKALSETEVTLRWSASKDDVGVVGYEVVRGNAILAAVKETAASESGLRAATRFCYLVRAVDAAGNRSAPAGPVCITTPDLTPPSAPAHGAAGAASDRAVTVIWSPSRDNVGVVRYELRRDGSTVTQTTATNATEAGLRPGRKVCYTVIAVDAAGNESEPGGPACATTPDVTPPTTPEDVIAHSNAPNRVTIVWKASSDDVGVAGYQVFRDGAVIADVSRTIAAEGALRPLTKYCYAVRAYDAAGNRSKPSATACATTTDPRLPSGPANVEVHSAAMGELVLSWDASPDPGVSYVVYWENDKRVGMTARTSFRVSGSIARDHCYRVSVVDAEGHESVKTLPICAAARPAISAH